MKHAFTMLELIFVLIVIGILAAVISPEMKSTKNREAAIQLISHIRYTQHLSMVDDKYNSANAQWHRNRWQITFNANQYSIESNNNTTFAMNTLKRDENLSNIALEDQTVAFSNGCAGHTIISFDHLGRPLVGDLSGTTASYTAGTLIAPYTAGQLINLACRITLTGASGDITSIDIEPETGYAHIN